VFGSLVGVLFLGLAGVGLFAILGSSPGEGGAPTAAAMAVGDCVRIDDDPSGVGVRSAPCGSTEANFKVVDTAPSADGCPADSDFGYTETADGTPVSAYCLDIDWVRGDCFELSGEYPVRVDCSAGPGAQTVRVVDTIRDSGDADRCPTDSARPYPARDMVVCLDQL
jgi:hypothetical protein